MFSIVEFEGGFSIRKGREEFYYLRKDGVNIDTVLELIKEVEENIRKEYSDRRKARKYKW